MYVTINSRNVDNIILLADVHLGVKSASVEWLDNIKTYFDTFFIPYLKAKVAAEQPDRRAVVVIAGDFFDCRQHIDINVLNVGIEIMLKLSAITDIFIVIGNHDIYKKENTDLNSSVIFKNFEHVYIIETPTIMSVNGGASIALIPWAGTHQKETELLKSLKEYSDCAIMHADISGLVYDNGRAITDGANAKIYGKKIYSGHIHKRQETPGVIYLGSPYQMKRSDTGNTKGIYCLNIKDDGKLAETFTENTVSPIFLKIRFADMLELPLGELIEKLLNNYVYIFMTKRESKEVNKAKLVDILDNCCARHIEFLVDSSSVDGDIQQNTAGDLTVNDIFVNTVQSMGDLNDADKCTLIDMNNAYMKLASDELSNSGMTI